MRFYLMCPFHMIQEYTKHQVCFIDVINLLILKVYNINESKADENKGGRIAVFYGNKGTGPSCVSVSPYRWTRFSSYCVLGAATASLKPRWIKAIGMI